MATHKSTWKARERKIAAAFGTTRTPMSGGASGHTRSDTLHRRLFIEAKLRVKHSAVTLWDGTKELAGKEDKTPVVVLAEKNRPGFWVMCHVDDLKAVADELVSQHPLLD
jgi:hypothetical protein